MIHMMLNTSVHCILTYNLYVAMQCIEIYISCILYDVRLVTPAPAGGYGVASMSRRLKIIRLFCRVSSLL